MSSPGQNPDDLAPRVAALETQMGQQNALSSNIGDNTDDLTTTVNNLARLSTIQQASQPQPIIPKPTATTASTSATISGPIQLGTPQSVINSSGNVNDISWTTVGLTATPSGTKAILCQIYGKVNTGTIEMDTRKNSADPNTQVVVFESAAITGLGFRQEAIVFVDSTINAFDYQITGGGGIAFTELFFSVIGYFPG